MKKILIVLFVFYQFYSCQKTTGSPDTSNPATLNCRITKITQGFNNDSIQHVVYDGQGKIVSVDDSVSGALNQSVYNATGGLTKILTDTRVNPATIEYNANGLPAKVVSDYGIVVYEYTYEYGSNGLPAKRTLTITSPDGYPPQTEYRKYAYDSGNEIIRTLDYAPADSSNYAMVAEYTYDSDSNIFKPFIFYQLDVLYGYLEIMDLDYYFNKRLVASKTEYSKVLPGNKSITINTYTHDSLHLITGSTTVIQTGDPLNNHLFTRHFFYGCK